MGNANPMSIMIVLVVAVLAVAGGIYGSIQARKRREGLFELAARLNLNFNAEQDYALPEQFGFLEEFQKGENRYATNVLSGAYQQHQVLAFDYHYETQYHDNKGSHTQHYWFSFLIVTLPARFPDLTIRRGNFLIKIAEAFGYQDIKFESAEFSRTFCVRSPDKKFAYDVCHAKMIDYLLANRDLSIEIEQQALALVFSTRLSVEQFEADLRRLVEVRGLLPDYLFTSA
jgi:hypothetical protein